MLVLVCRVPSHPSCRARCLAFFFIGAKSLLWLSCASCVLHHSAGEPRPDVRCMRHSSWCGKASGSRARLLQVFSFIENLPRLGQSAWAKRKKQLRIRAATPVSARRGAAPAAPLPPPRASSRPLTRSAGVVAAAEAAVAAAVRGERTQPIGAPHDGTISAAINHGGKKMAEKRHLCTFWEVTVIILKFSSAS